MQATFGFTLKIYYNIVMGIVSKNAINTTNSSIEKVEEFQLAKKEIEWLLNLIKDSTFKGADLEQVYNAVYKLQQQYIQTK
jgi:hypothetical protein